MVDVELAGVPWLAKLVALLLLLAGAVGVLVWALAEIARGRRVSPGWVEGQRRSEIRVSGAQPEGVCGQWDRFARRFEDEDVG